MERRNDSTTGIEAREYEAQSEQLERSRNVLTELLVTLDQERGGEVAAMDRIERSAENADAPQRVLGSSAFHTASSSSGSPSPVAADTG